MSVEHLREYDRPRNRGITKGEKEQIEINSPQQARDMARNKALPLSHDQRDELKRLADNMEAKDGL